MHWLVRLLVTCCKPKMALAVENLCLRQQLAVYKQRCPRPHLRDRDRWFWILITRWFTGWKDWLVIVEPATVIAWRS